MIDPRLTLALLLGLTPFLYAVAWVSYILVFRRDRPGLRRAAHGWLTAATGVHGAYLIGFTTYFGHLPLVNVYELVGVVAFAVAASHLWIESRTATVYAGPFVLAAVCVFQTVSAASPRFSPDVPEILRSRLFSFHVSTAVLGYSAFALSAVYGLLYLLQYHGLRAHRFGLLFRQLPALTVLDRMNRHAAVLGLACLTVAILLGAEWSRQAFGGLVLDPKVFVAVVTWLVYALALGGRRFAAWTATETAYSTLVGFAIVLFSMFAVGVYWSRFHVFGG